MPHRITTWLEHIRMSINNIYEFLGTERDFNAYKNNKMLRQAVERNLEIIGEAMNRILAKNPDYPIQYARRIVGLRNLIIQTYDGIEDSAIWTIIVRDLPKLKEEVDALLIKE